MDKSLLNAVGEIIKDERQRTDDLIASIPAPPLPIDGKDADPSDVADKLKTDDDFISSINNSGLNSYRKNL